MLRHISNRDRNAEKNIIAYDRRITIREVADDNPWSARVMAFFSRVFGYCGKIVHGSSTTTMRTGLILSRLLDNFWKKKHYKFTIPSSVFSRYSSMWFFSNFINKENHEVSSFFMHRLKGNGARRSQKLFQRTSFKTISGSVRKETQEQVSLNFAGTLLKAIESI